MSSSLNHCYKTPHYPLQVRTHNFEGISPVAPFAWQSSKAFLFYFTQNSCLKDSIRHPCREAEFQWQHLNVLWMYLLLRLHPGSQPKAENDDFHHVIAEPLWFFIFWGNFICPWRRKSKFLIDAYGWYTLGKGLEVKKKKKLSLQRLGESDSFICTDGRKLCSICFCFHCFADKKSKVKQHGWSLIVAGVRVPSDLAQWVHAQASSPSKHAPEQSASLFAILTTWDPRHRVTCLATNTEVLRVSARAQKYILGSVRDLKIAPMWQHCLDGFGKTASSQQPRGSFQFKVEEACSPKSRGWNLEFS